MYIYICNICINIHVIIKGNAIYTLTLSWPREIDAYLIVRNLELTMDKPYIVRFWKVVVPMVSKMFHEVDKWFKKSKKHIWGSEVLQVWPPNCSLGFHFFVHLVHCFFASMRLFYKASRQRGTTSYACHAPWNRSDRKWRDFGTGLICRTTTCWSNILMFVNWGTPKSCKTRPNVRLKVGIPFFTKGSSICCIWIPQVFPLARPPNLGDTVEKSTSWWAKSHFL